MEAIRDGSAKTPLLSAAPKERLGAMLAAIPAQRPAAAASISRRGLFGALAASVVAGIVADRAFIGIGRSLSQKDEGGEWRAVVAGYIALYTPETLAGPVPTAEVQTAQLADEGRSYVRQSTPLDRGASPLELAKVVRFLLSDDASFITGEEIRVDGGFSASGFSVGRD